MGHKKAFCYRFPRKTHQAWKAGKCFIERKWFGKVSIAKTDLYPSWVQVFKSEDILCNHVMISEDEDAIEEDLKIALTANEQNMVRVWYFDSGFSQHMTGDGSILKNLLQTTGKRLCLLMEKRGKFKELDQLIAQNNHMSIW